MPHLPTKSVPPMLMEGAIQARALSSRIWVKKLTAVILIYLIRNGLMAMALIPLVAVAVGVILIPVPLLAPVAGSACGASKQGSHLAGIIAGEKAGGSGIQGIAYEAKIKPIDIYAPTTILVKELDIIDAIAEASGMVDTDACSYSYLSTAKLTAEVCKPITVMNNGWNIPSLGIYTEMVSGTADTDYYYAGVLNTITTDERTAWKAAVANAPTGNTVVVFAAGDNGQNSINGEVQLYTDVIRTTKHGDPVLWSSLPGGGGNQASSHARLPTVNEADNSASLLKGKWLTVIALDGKNTIAPFSNGCGDTKAYCLGAPGVDINSAIPGGGYEKQSGTAQAAAHVSAAIAVVASTFGSMTPSPNDLIAIILRTADYIPLPVGEVAGSNTNAVYGYGALNLARATSPLGRAMTGSSAGTSVGADASLDNSGITLPTSFGGALDGFTVGFIDDYKRAFIGYPERIAQANASFTLADTLATWESPELQNIALDSNSKMQFINGDDNENGKDTLMFTHSLPNHTIGFAYNEESKTPDLNLANAGDDLHFQKIRPIANDLMQVNSTHKLGKALTVKNAITSGEFDTGNRFNEAMTNLNYASENHNLTIGAGTLQEYGQFLGASGTGAYQLSDATQSTVTHLAITQNLPLGSAIKLKYTNFKTEVDMLYSNFANINNLTADEYQLTLTKKQILGKNDSLNLELIQPFAVTDGNLQQNTVLGYTAEGDYNNVTQNYSLAPANRRQQLRMTWQNQLNHKTKTKLFISMQYENHVNNLQDNKDSQILGGVSTRF